MNKTIGILGKIQKTLESFSYPVYYGRSFAKKDDDWNYFVFNRYYIEKSGKSNCDFNYHYQIHIIMEDYIPEGFEQEVIKTIQENTNLKLVDSSMNFNYATKSGTDMVVEMLTIEFTKPVRGCNLNG
ncbi:MAG: hypothetical protein ACLTK6_15670 [Clostridium perfringens]|mgnify:FL=1